MAAAVTGLTAEGSGPRDPTAEVPGPGDAPHSNTPAVRRETGIHAGKAVHCDERGMDGTSGVNRLHKILVSDICRIPGNLFAIHILWLDDIIF